MQSFPKRVAALPSETFGRQAQPVVKEKDWVIESLPIAIGTKKLSMKISVNLPT